MVFDWKMCMKVLVSFNCEASELNKQYFISTFAAVFSKQLNANVLCFKMF